MHAGTNPTSTARRAGRRGCPSRRGATRPWRRCCRPRRPCPRPARSPSPRHWRPCRWAATGAHRPMPAGRTAEPTRRSGPGQHTTPDWGRRRSPTRRVDCEMVASTRCPSLWPNVILEKSHSPTTTGHFGFTTRSSPLPNRCIEVKSLSARVQAVRSSVGPTAQDGGTPKPGRARCPYPTRPSPSRSLGSRWPVR